MTFSWSPSQISTATPTGSRAGPQEYFANSKLQQALFHLLSPCLNRCPSVLPFFAFFSLMLLPTVSLLITRFKHATQTFKVRYKEKVNAYDANEAVSAHDEALRDHKGAYDRYEKLHTQTPLEHKSQLSDIRKALIHHRRMMDHHEDQKELHGKKANQSNSGLCIDNRCEDAPASKKVALKSAKSAKKSSSHAKSAVNALNHAEPLLGSRSKWRVGKAYLGDALHYTHKAEYETRTDRCRKAIRKVFHQ